MTLNPNASRLLIAFHTVVLRGPSPLSEGERELITAFVSGLNACDDCHGVHAATARAFGVDDTLLTELVTDPDCTAADQRMRPLFRFLENS